MNARISLAEVIKTRGFFHQKGFLAKEEIADLKRLREQVTGPNMKAPLRHVDGCSIFDQALLHRLGTLQKECFPDDELFLYGASFFSIFKNDADHSINLPYHQDATSFFLYQEHYYYLNFYLVIEKSDPENANLTIVPFDILQTHDPVLYQLLLRSGATRFRNGQLINDYLGWTHTPVVNLDDISVTPQLDVGDLLVWRGDTLHKTHNLQADRVSVSLRAMNKKSVTKRHKLTTLAYSVLDFMSKKADEFAMIDYIYAHENTDRLTAQQQYLKFMDLIDASTPQPRSLKCHTIIFKIKIWLLRQYCRLFRIGTATPL